jgi:glycosyltransferase involved in cell wall biosynthesis
MSQPAVSILLPVYNSEKYLRQAIDSLLNQTFTNFELLIINDGSIDQSEKVIISYDDSRIVYLKNDRNRGLIYTLNKGIELAKGKYIARMDADDICCRDRLQKQFDWLEKSKETTVISSQVSFINENGIETGDWKDDLETTTFASIKQKMIWVNCIAHPTVMIHSDILKQYKYSGNQVNTEDYDLWLRLLADGHKIEKIPEKLLLYRVHQLSITGSDLRKSNPFFKQYHCKIKFLQQRIASGKWGLFESKILLTTIHNSVMGIGKNIKSVIRS